MPKPIARRASTQVLRDRSPRFPGEPRKPRNDPTRTVPAMQARARAGASENFPRAKQMPIAAAATITTSNANIVQTGVSGSTTVATAPTTAQMASNAQAAPTLHRAQRGVLVIEGSIGQAPIRATTGRKERFEAAAATGKGKVCASAARRREIVGADRSKEGKGRADIEPIPARMLLRRGGATGSGACVLIDAMSRPSAGWGPEAARAVFARWGTGRWTCCGCAGWSR